MRTIGTGSTGAATTEGARTAPVWNPATGEQQAEVLLAEADDVDAAVARGGRGLRGVVAGVAEPADEGPVRVPRARQRATRTSSPR